MTPSTPTQAPTRSAPSKPGRPRRAPGLGGSLPAVCAWLLAACLAGGFVVPLSAGESAPAEADTPAAAAPSVPAAATSPVVHPQRPFTEQDLLKLLTETLQQQYVKDRGELELRLSQPWKSRNVPDEPLTLKVLDMPNLGVTPMFIVRFELRAADTTVGAGQVAVQARVWRDVWTARSALKRGQSISEADVCRERRDLLIVHEPLAEFAPDDSTLELAEPVGAGSLLLARSVKMRPVIHRGQTADALLRDGVLTISMKVEALEDGAPGQMIRVRNSQSRRDIRGKVMNEQTILISL
jgi:flagella basal body P-ring formation protein FlgA